ncbi:MAG: glycoside hydrolase family 57 protein [Bacteroidota bacterium]
MDVKPQICLYFQVHQPYRLTPYSALDIGRHLPYFDSKTNADILHRVADNCYLPANQALMNAIRQTDGAFRVAFSISGSLIDQLEILRPDVIRSFQQLAETGSVEFLAETHHHSLSFLYSREEFFRQVIQHKEKIWGHFRQDPQVFRNTELIYSNPMAWFVRQMGFKGMLAEGVGHHLHGRSANYLYAAPHIDRFAVLLRNAGLSDDMGFRFSDQGNADQYAAKVLESGGEVMNLFLDYESFGEHQSAASGIMGFLEALPMAIIRQGGSFGLPTEIATSLTAHPHYDVPEFTSWADASRDLSPWLNNDMQKEALEKVYELQQVVMDTHREDLMETWSRLQSSDHFYYMSTKGGPDGEVHAHFRPYARPFDAYMAFMNVISDFQLTLREC